VQAKTPGKGVITVSGGRLKATTFYYSIRALPDPVPLLGAQYSSSDSIRNGVLKAQGGIGATFGGDFGFEARCDVISYYITYIGKQNESVTKLNSGARFGDEVREIIDRAKPGDRYFFYDIKARCPGDTISRKLGALIFLIK